MRLSIILIFIAILCSANAFADDADIEKYLSELKTMTADFQQTAPDGVISTGKFQLKRPSQMRWQYNPPTPVIMVTRGNYLTYYDYELNQVSDIPLDDTLLSVLTQENIKFNDSNVVVVGNYQNKELVTITLEQKDAPENGSLGMIFKKEPMQLQHLIVTDATGSITEIALNNIVENVELDDEVFHFRDPRIGGKRKKI